MEDFKIIYSDDYKVIINYHDVQQWIRDNYLKFNVLYFDDILPPADRIIFEPVIKNCRYLGCAYNNKYGYATKTMPFKIRINFIYDMGPTEWKNVLLHEMIHIWEFTMGYKGGHGKLFKSKMKEINSFGWGITCEYKNIIDNLKYASDRQRNS